GRVTPSDRDARWAATFVRCGRAVMQPAASQTVHAAKSAPIAYWNHCMKPRNLLTRRPAADYSSPAVRGRSSVLLILGLSAALAAAATARAGVRWKGASSGCEPLATFYSSSHQ